MMKTPEAGSAAKRAIYRAIGVNPEAIEAVYPGAEVQLCSVHLVRNSLNFVSWKQRKEVAADLRTIYPAATPDDATLALDAFALKWDAAYPQIAKSWRNHWARVIPYLCLCAGDPATVWDVTPATLMSQGKNNPLLGARLTGQNTLTLVGGNVVYDALGKTR